MLDHVSLGVGEIARSRRFYDAVLRPLGLVRTLDFENRGSDYGAIPGQFGVEFTITAEAGRIVPARGMHLCFRARDREAVRAFHAAATARGGRDEADLACARSTIGIITPRSSSTRTVAVSRPYAMRLRHRK